MLESLESVNHSLFLTINASEHPPVAVYWFAWFNAEILIYVLALGLMIAWLRGSTEMRQALVYAGLVGAVALLINQLIGMVWYHPRPLEIGLGHTLLAHRPETSFPSDHATVFFSVTLALIRWPGVRKLGIALIPISLLVAWSRIWLGIHFPLDMLGSLLVSGAVVVTLHRLLMVTSDYINWVGERMIMSEKRKRAYSFGNRR